MSIYLLVFAGAVVLTIGMTPLARWLAPRLGVMDTPAARKVHRRPVPRLGGAAITLAVIVAALLLVVNGLIFGVIISFLNSSWGPQARGLHRYLAMNKRTGAVVWWASPGGPPLDTTYSMPSVTVVGGVRMLGKIFPADTSDRGVCTNSFISENILNCPAVLARLA